MRVGPAVRIPFAPAESPMRTSLASSSVSTERYRERLARVLSCYDRMIVTGTLPGACYAKGMTGFLSARQIRIFDYPRFAEPLRGSSTRARRRVGCQMFWVSRSHELLYMVGGSWNGTDDQGRGLSRSCCEDIV